MRADQEFLKKLEKNLMTTEEVLDEASNDEVIKSTEEMKIIVREGLHFLQEREEFWTNVK